MRIRIPPCPGCKSNDDVTWLAWATMLTYVLEIFVCPRCRETFEFKVEDPHDPRLFTRPVHPADAPAPRINDLYRR